jgi:hypothetical protein
MCGLLLHEKHSYKRKKKEKKNWIKSLAIEANTAINLLDEKNKNTLLANNIQN